MITRFWQLFDWEQREHTFTMWEKTFIPGHFSVNNTKPSRHNIECLCSAFYFTDIKLRKGSYCAKGVFVDVIMRMWLHWYFTLKRSTGIHFVTNSTVKYLMILDCTVSNFRFMHTLFGILLYSNEYETLFKIWNIATLWKKCTKWQSSFQWTQKP